MSSAPKERKTTQVQREWKAKPKDTTPKISPCKRIDPKYEDNAAVGPAIVVLVTGKGVNTSQITVHRPIGVTSLKKDDWVFTDTQDVNSLLERRVDPDAERTAKLRKDYLLSAATRQDPPLLVEIEGKLMYPGSKSTDKPRGIFLRDATALLKKAEAKAQDQFLKAYPSPKDRVGLKPEPTEGILALFPEEVRTQEAALRGYLAAKESKEEAKKEFPLALFETRSGNRCQTRQQASSLSGRTIAQVKDAIIDCILNRAETAPPKGYGVGRYSPTPEEKGSWSYYETLDDDEIADEVSGMTPYLTYKMMRACTDLLLQNGVFNQEEYDAIIKVAKDSDARASAEASA